MSFPIAATGLTSIGGHRLSGHGSGGQAGRASGARKSIFMPAGLGRPMAPPTRQPRHDRTSHQAGKGHEGTQGRRNGGREGRSKRRKKENLSPYPCGRGLGGGGRATAPSPQPPPARGGGVLLPSILLFFCLSASPVFLATRCRLCASQSRPAREDARWAGRFPPRSSRQRSGDDTSSDPARSTAGTHVSPAPAPCACASSACARSDVMCSRKIGSIRSGWPARTASRPGFGVPSPCRCT